MSDNKQALRDQLVEQQEILSEFGALGLNDERAKAIVKVLKARRELHESQNRYRLILKDHHGWPLLEKVLPYIKSRMFCLADGSFSNGDGATHVVYVAQYDNKTVLELWQANVFIHRFDEIALDGSVDVVGYVRQFAPYLFKE